MLHTEAYCHAAKLQLDSFLNLRNNDLIAYCEVHEVRIDARLLVMLLHESMILQ